MAAAASRLASAFLPCRQVLHDTAHSTGCTLKSKPSGVACAQRALSPGPVDNFKCKYPSQSTSASEGSKVRMNVRAAAVNEVTGSLLKASGHRFCVVAARFNEIITKPLLSGALETFQKYGVEEGNVDVVWVPGSFEIPLVAQILAKSDKYNAILCIGAVVRGATSHYDAVANSAASGIMSAGLSSGVPCIFCVLTCDTMEQAIDRAGGKAGNKGAECAVTAIEVAALLNHSLPPLLLA